MITLDSLAPHEGAVHKRKRVGRGPASGKGKTAGKGQKGQKSRSGATIPAGFQGGQMPLYRQLPKRGFKNPFRKIYGVMNVGDLEDISYDDVIDIKVLQSMGRIRKKMTLLKILGDGDLTKPVKVKAHAISAAARKKIEDAGGSVEIVA